MEPAVLFPRPTSTFRGREADLDAIAASIDGPDRLVTIVGPGGIGKTRLATEVARAERRRAGKGAEGPWFCDLGEALTSANICICLASALDVALASSSVEAQVVQLGYALASRPRALVVFDNFEQVVEHAPQTLVRWLSIAQHARFLVTSRERLRVPGEVVLDLGPLPLPQEGDDPLTSEAVQLFLDRSRGGSPVRELTSDDAACVAEIVRRLDGMPLAIELAASRTSVLTPSSLLARLERPLEVLSLGHRGAVGRHATVGSTIAWSWSLLAAHEQAALAQCSVFAGGFTLEAAEEILALPKAASGEETSALDALQALRDASLLRAYAASDAHAEARFALFEAIREFAYDKLVASGALAETMRRHATYFLREGRAWARDVLGPRGPEEIRRIERERHNLLAIARRATAVAPPTVGAANEALLAMRILEPPAFSGLAADRNGLLASILTYARTAMASPSAVSPLASGDRLGVREQGWDEALPYALEPRGLDGSSLAFGWLARGRALANVGAVPDALEAQERALALAREAGDVRVEGTALVCIAYNMCRQAKNESLHNAALQAMRRALDFRYEGDERSRAYLMACQTCLSSDFAALDADAGSIDRIVELGERTLDLLRRTGNRLMEGVIEHLLGDALATAGRLSDARVHCERALTICPDFGSTWFVAGTHVVLGAIASEKGDLPRAAEELALAIPAARRSGSKFWEAIALTDVGMLRYEERRAAEAKESLTSAISIFRALDRSPVWLGVALGALAVTAVGERRLADAEELVAQSTMELMRGARSPDQSLADLLPGFLEVTQALGAANEGDDETATAWLDKARARVDTATDPNSVPRRSRYGRQFTRLLHRTINAFTSRAGALLVGPEAAWFKSPGGERVKVGQKSPRLLLLYLAETRDVSPGKAVGREELFRRGWPGERAGRDAVTNRVFVAIATLRKLGLGRLIVSRDDGWLLEPSVALIRVTR